MTAPSNQSDPVTVLVIDDTPEIRLLLSKWIERLDGFHLVGDVGDGRSGIDAARLYQPRIVLLDLAMPVMDGLEALPLIRAASPHSRVIVLSGFEKSRMSAATMERGAAAYIQKGTPLTELARVLADVAERPLGATRLSTAAPPDVGSQADALPASAAAEDELARIYGAVGVVAHEIRGPVSIIATLAGMMESTAGPATDDERREFLDIIQTQCRMIDRVTSDLVVAARHRQRNIPMSTALVDVLPALRSAATAFSSDAEVFVTCPLGLTVLADEIRLQQMLGNLLSNAVKYGEPPIRLVALAVPGQVEFRVIDSGPGVSEEFGPLLFQPFARAAGRSNSGTGLGLSVVRALADAHGGRAWYEDGTGGAAFCFSLPTR